MVSTPTICSQTGYYDFRPLAVFVRDRQTGKVRKIDDAFETALFACSAGKTDSVSRGTSGSNRLCSSVESAANLTSSLPRTAGSLRESGEGLAADQFRDLPSALRAFLEPPDRQL